MIIYRNNNLNIMSDILKKNGYSSSGGKDARRNAIKAALKDDSNATIKALESEKGKNAEDDLKYAKLLVILAKGRAKRKSRISKKGGRKSRKSRKSKKGGRKSRKSRKSKKGGRRSKRGSRK